MRRQPPGSLSHPLRTRVLVGIGHNDVSKIIKIMNISFISINQYQDTPLLVPKIFQAKPYKKYFSQQVYSNSTTYWNLVSKILVVVLVIKSVWINLLVKEGEEADDKDG